MACGQDFKLTDGSSSKTVVCVANEFKFLLEDGAQAPADTTHLLELPPWFDWDKFRRGQLYFRKNYFALFVAKLCGLLSILAIPSILRVLVLTRQSGEPVAAFRRYVMTLTHMLDWYDGDLLEPTSRAHKSLMGVRTRHCAAARKARKAGFGPISQLDMVLTQFGFMGFGVLAPEKLGITGTPEEQEGFVHFWRTIGYMLGIEDRFNLCKETVAETQQLCSEMLEQVFAPALKQPAEGFDQMSRSLLDAMWVMVPFLQYDAFLGFARRLSGVEAPLAARASLYSRVLLSYQVFVHEVVLCTALLAWLFRPILNFGMWFSVFMTQRLPLLAYVTFGRSHVY
ncbi:uncharacterized protein [Periplaneta americana]|uniref:uncharacterized protein isoform X2 n=1 Tax=Periplaneta americana TaxID=6978 RepID=UPI0037E7230D